MKFSLSRFLVVPSSRLLGFLVAATLLITHAHAQVVDIFHSPCDVPPLPPPVTERIENRTFPSIYQLGGDLTNPDLSPLPWGGYEYEQRSAMRDLGWGPFYWITTNWTPNALEEAPNWGLETSITTQNAPQSRRRILAQNPNHVFLGSVALHAHGDLNVLPPDSDYWLRDDSGQILHNTNGAPLIDFVKPETQKLIIQRILAFARCGFYDGVWFDGFAHNGTGFVGRDRFPYTDEQIIQACLNIFREVRSQARDDFLIIVNANDSRPTRYTNLINGVWMERIGIFAEYPVVDDIHNGLQEAEDLLAWHEENLRYPQIACLHGAGTERELLDSPNNRRWMRVFTTLSLTHSDGYVSYDTDNGAIWYPFWDADLGQPVGSKAQLYQNIDGLFIREFTNGWAVYNRSGKEQTITLPRASIGVSSNKQDIIHLLPNFDGEIYLRVGKPYDLNRDGTINILDLILASQHFGTTEGDINGDGTTNILDLTRVAQQFSQ